MTISKKGFRVLGIAESFSRSLTHFKNMSVVAGIVMRGDFFVDGLIFNTITLGGLDATERILDMIENLNRPDVGLIMLGGTIISLYNIIDLHELYEEAKLPIIAVTYRESEGIGDILLNLPQGEKRLEIYRRNGPRIPIILRNGYKVFIRHLGITLDDAIKILNRFTIHGRYPEPVRVAKMIARAVLYFLERIKGNS